MKQEISAEVSRFNHKQAILQSMPKNIKAYIIGQVHNRTTKETYSLLPEQQEVLRDYYVYLVTEKGKIKSHHTYLNKISKVNQFGRFVNKPFNQVTKEDLKSYFFKLHSEKKTEGTINNCKLQLKLFFQFLYGKDKPVLVDWIEIPSIQSKLKTEEELLTRLEIRRLIEKADNPRDKAIIAVLYESAARKTEFLSIKLKHVLPDKYGIRIKLPESKTKDRIVRLEDATSYLQEWLNHHPNNEDIEQYLWIGFSNRCYGKRFGDFGLLDLLHKLAKRASIQKNVHPHIMRHSRLNELAKLGFNERDLRLFAGWSDDSKMPKIYLHYGEKELDKKFLRKSGKLDLKDTEQETKEKEALKPKVCVRCTEVNNATNRFCFKCGMELDVKEFKRKEYLEQQENVKEATDELLRVFAEIMSDSEKREQYEEFKRVFFKESN